MRVLLLSLFIAAVRLQFPLGVDRVAYAATLLDRRSYMTVSEAFGIPPLQRTYALSYDLAYQVPSYRWPSWWYYQQCLIKNVGPCLRHPRHFWRREYCCKSWCDYWY